MSKVEYPTMADDHAAGRHMAEPEIRLRCPDCRRDQDLPVLPVVHWLIDNGSRLRCDAAITEDRAASADPRKVTCPKCQLELIGAPKATPQTERRCRTKKS